VFMIGGRTTGGTASGDRGPSTPCPGSVGCPIITMPGSTGTGTMGTLRGIGAGSSGGRTGGSGGLDIGGTLGADVVPVVAVERGGGGAATAGVCTIGGAEVFGMATGSGGTLGIAGPIFSFASSATKP